jgi:hypothetical protein
MEAVYLDVSHGNTASLLLPDVTFLSGRDAIFGAKNAEGCATQGFIVNLLETR